MTKKEQVEMAALKQQLAEARALRFTEMVEPNIAPPTNYGGIVNGYVWHQWGLEYRVEKGCTSSGSHSRGQWDKTTSQNARSLYSTELLATRAARSQMARVCAKVLAALDQRIEELAALDAGAKVGE